jgi:DNA-binding NarL/FixJ family response regulator
MVVAKKTIVTQTTDTIKDKQLAGRKQRQEITPREVEILKLIWEECTAKEIGAELGISPRTVEAHRWNICHKVGAKTTIGLIKYALRKGIVTLDQ